MVSFDELTAAPVDAPLWPVAASWLFARLRALSWAMVAAEDEDDWLELVTVPATALVCCTPPTDPPEVLT